MSQIPPNPLASAIGGVGAAARESERRSRSESSDAARGVSSVFGDRLDNIIRNDDRDSSVSSDAESFNGGQGRAHKQAEEPESAQDAEPDRQPLPGGQLDLQA